MTDHVVPPGDSPAWRVARAGAYAVVTSAVALFVIGMAWWVQNETIRESIALWVLPSTWNLELLVAATDDGPVSLRLFAAYVMLLDVVWVVVGVGAAVLVLRGATTWFRLYLAVVLALWSTTGGTLTAVYAAAVGGVLSDVVELLSGLGWIGMLSLAYLFPDGRFVPRWTRWCAAAFAVYVPALAVIELVAPERADSVAVLLPALLLFATGAYAAVFRYRRMSSPEQRRQVRGVMAALVLWLAVVTAHIVLRRPLGEPVPAGLIGQSIGMLLSYTAVVLLCASVGVAVLRHRLYGIDVWVNRALVYGGLTACVALLYAVLAAIGALIWPGDGWAGPLLATVVLAVVLHPLRLRLQRAVDRFVYGHSMQPRELLADLSRSRERIVRAREDERSRLQRDLHDGLGPTLASLYQRVDAARALIQRDPVAAEGLLEDVGTQTRSVIGEIRTIVSALRPPELDQLGLQGALETLASRFEPMSTRFSGADLTGIHPAVEVAAYRIGAEALTNAARHSGADQAWVTLERTPRTLRIVVADNGTQQLSGSAVPHRGPVGTGLRSMLDRAEELGGSVEWTAGPHGGTVVGAILPWLDHEPGTGESSRDAVTGGGGGVE